MGRTKRKRKKGQATEKHEFNAVIELQKSLRLKCPKIKISYFDEIGWGVRCKDYIDEGEIIIALPLRQLITTNVDSEVLRSLGIEKESPQFLLSIFLVYESHLREKSKYYEYIQSLPKSYSNPYFCKKDEVKLLPEFLKKEVLAQSSFVNSNVRKVFQIVNGKSCAHCGENLKNIFSHESFVWAWFTVNTRSVYYEGEDQSKSLALAPFLDLLNHSNDAVTKLCIDFENGLYILRSLNSYKKFEQVFIKYGGHTNLKLYLEYGFILPVNDNDCIEFSFEEVLEGVRALDSRFGDITKLKYSFIKTNKLNQDLGKGTEFSWNFQGLVYVLTTADQDLNILQNKTYSNLFTPTEKDIIQKIGKIVSKNKFDDLQSCLVKMEAINNCTESFKIAKNLLKHYMKLLQGAEQFQQIL